MLESATDCCLLLFHDTGPGSDRDRGENVLPPAKNPSLLSLCGGPYVDRVLPLMMLVRLNWKHPPLVGISVVLNPDTVLADREEVKTL